MRKRIFFGFLLSNSLLIAQTGIGSGYVAPAPVSVAPGQIATFYLPGLLSAGAAGSGILGATLQQGAIDTPAPIQSLRAISLCPDNTATAQPACGSLLAVTVQIPYELIPLCPLCARPVYTVPPLLIFSASGQSPTAIELNALADQVHVLTACDVALGPPAPAQPNLTGLRCAPLVTHTDGSLVSSSSPAHAGEALTTWAFGLGQTNPAATTGEPAPTASVAAETFFLNFNYQVNALATKPYTGEPDVQPPQPLFAGTAPGFVGLYQVNFIVPQAPPNGIAQCALPGAAAAGANVAQSNLTVSVGGQSSFDGAGICVTTQIPVD